VAAELFARVFAMGHVDVVQQTRCGSECYPSASGKAWDADQADLNGKNCTDTATAKAKDFREPTTEGLLRRCRSQGVGF
jgi:hypothetical protein